MNRLKGKYILITGASQGLGRQLAIDFAREGAAGIVIVARRADALERVAASIHEAEPKAEVLMITADLSSEGEIERVVATTLNEFRGRLDVLVNNASSIGPTPLPYLLDYPLEDFRQVLETNLTAPFLLIKKALPAMIENVGRLSMSPAMPGASAILDGALTASLNSVLKECLRLGRRSWKEVPCVSTGSIPGI